ncbi:MAG: hypothetical protein IPF83_13240 [Rhodanobacteraceae bacterium]|nr:hypothetical protein [Rhodanobacteraceae bacterium]
MEDMCDAFSAGRIRFLVSTEAGGEGIDLRERCSALIHVDLPWNHAAAPTCPPTQPIRAAATSRSGIAQEPGYGRSHDLAEA